MLPAMVVAAVCEAANGAHPSYAQDYYRRDNAFYRAWEEISRERESFLTWIERHVRGTRDMRGLLASLEIAR